MIPAIEQLRRRKLVQWALAYLAGAWLALQVVALLGSTYEWPAAVLRSTPLVLGAGLFAVLVLAWYHGEKGAQRVSGPELLLLGLVLALAAGSIAWIGRPDAAPGAATASEGAAPGSIAVLPFLNLAGGADQEYFSDGLSEELLNALAHVPGLRVAARTSSFSFRGQEVPADEIGRRLGVAYLLEGSVRRAGDRVRIRVQLVDAASGYQLWSRTYDRQLQDLFAVQEEIGRSVVAALPLTLAVHAPLVRGSTTDPEAHDLYLMGRYAWNRRTGPEILRAIGFFEQAIARDPQYARAYAALAEAYAVVPGYVSNRSLDEIMEKVRAAALRALELDPGLGEPHNAMAVLHHQYELDPEAGEAAFRRALELNPNYANAHQWYGEFLALRGLYDPAEAALRRALELDPLSPIIRSDFGQVLYLRREYERAIAQLEPLARERPDFSIAQFWLLRAYLGAGRFTEALSVVEPVAGLVEMDPAALRAVVEAQLVPDRRADAVRALAAHPRDGSYLARWNLAGMYALVGEESHALDLLERLYEGRAFAAYIEADPILDPLRDHPRFRRIAARIRTR